MIYFIEIARSFYWGSSHDDCYKHEDQYSFTQISQGSVHNVNEVSLFQISSNENLKVLITSDNLFDTFNANTADTDEVIIEGAREYLKLLVRKVLSNSMQDGDIYNVHEVASLIHQKAEIKKELADSKYKSEYLTTLEYLNQTRYQATDDLARYYESQSKYKLIEIELIKQIEKAPKLNDLFNIVETLGESVREYKTSYGL